MSLRGSVLPPKQSPHMSGIASGKNKNALAMTSFLEMGEQLLQIMGQVIQRTLLNHRSFLIKTQTWKPKL